MIYTLKYNSKSVLPRVSIKYISHYWILCNRQHLTFDLSTYQNTIYWHEEVKIYLIYNNPDFACDLFVWPQYPF